MIDLEIHFLNQDLDPQGKIQQIVQITTSEPHLLSQSTNDIAKASKDGRVIIAVDQANPTRLVGCAIVWNLTRDEHGQIWYELGTLFVIPEYRYPVLGMSVADKMYRVLLKTFAKINILATTTSARAAKVGLRNNLVHIRFDDLPQIAHTVTCCCPATKTGVTDNSLCPLKGKNCFARITHETWQRLGYPDIIPFPFSLSTQAETSQPDNSAV
ncbi:hypothetical protein ACFLZY_02000 [Patescibacteria group bacterium]